MNESRLPRAQISFSDRVYLASLLVLVVVVNALLTSTAGFELHYEEAQYWEWSQQLDWSYYSKGPLTAWLIALSTYLFGHGEWQVRLFGWFAHGALLIVMFAFARDVWGNRAAAWWAALITACTPLYFVLGLAMTTDNFLFLFWAWACWALYRALFMEQPRAWYEVGIAVGLGAITKLSIGLLPAFAGVWMLARRDLRAHFLRPQLWGGGALLLLITAPMWIWNAQHGWTMVQHEMGHVENQTFSIARGVEMLASQIIALSPLVVVLAVTVLWRRPLQVGHRLLWGLSLAWIAFFFFKTVGGKIQPNWPAPSYIPLLALFAGHIPAWSALKRRTLYFGVATSAALVTVICFSSAFGISAANIAPIKKMKAWRASISELAQRSGPVDFIITMDYPLTGELAFYWPQRVPVYYEGEPDRRMTQHDLWPSIDREQGRNAVFVHTGPERPPELERAFRQCTPLPPVQARDRDGSLMRTLYATRCEDYRPIVWPKVLDY